MVSRVVPKVVERLLCLVMALCWLSGCGVVDQFSDRALTYNDQAEMIKEQQFLVNIMRAASREPLQFSDFSQVTGQASASGSAAFSLPIAVVPQTLSRTYTASPGATVSGTQSFTIDNLDTQDFYEGILAPIPLSSIDYYMESEYPKALVLTLFVSSIELKSISGQAPDIVYENSLYGNYRKFEAVLQAAIDLGLTTEPVNATKAIGPPMTAAQLSDIKYLSTVGGQNMALQTYEIQPGSQHTELTAAQQVAFASQHVTEYYRLVSKEQKNRFCFAGDASGDIPPATLALAKQDLADGGVMSGGKTLSGIKIPPQAICGSMDNGGDTADSDTASNTQNKTGVEIDITTAGQPVAEKYRIEITTRSVEGILYYLGEWTRGELGVGRSGTVIAPPMVRTNEGTDALFVVRRECDPSMPNVTAEYFDKNFCMEIDPSGQDRSTEVMEITLQLFALNNSAKNLPSPNLISVLSP
jgi:hypothetical protein